MNSSNKIFGVVLGAGLALAGCATGPEAVENDFGNSVRHMVQAQTANPAAPADSNAIDHGDGQRINNALDAYRKDVSAPKDVKREIIVGGGSSN